MNRALGFKAVGAIGLAVILCAFQNCSEIKKNKPADPVGVARLVTYAYVQIVYKYGGGYPAPYPKVTPWGELTITRISDDFVKAEYLSDECPISTQLIPYRYEYAIVRAVAAAPIWIAGTPGGPPQWADGPYHILEMEHQNGMTESYRLDSGDGIQTGQRVIVDQGQVSASIEAVLDLVRPFCNPRVRSVSQ